jgi:FkbM family methyltransferase
VHPKHTSLDLRKAEVPTDYVRVDSSPDPGGLRDWHAMALGMLYEQFVRVGDELGVTTRSDFVSGETVSMVGDPLPHEAFEWMALFDAIAEASTRFTMLEVGAGFGRWTVRAAAAIRRYRPDLTYRLVAVEAEPTHFEWLAIHTADNEVMPHSSEGTCELINAAVSRNRGEEPFYFGDPAAWYGQALVRPENVGAEAPIQPVATVGLSEILRKLDRVDLIDLDIQGAESEVLSESASLLGRVSRIYVETHSSVIDEHLVNIFEHADGDWSQVVAVPLGADRLTPLGEANFDDGGVQLWVNGVRDGARAGAQIENELRERSQPWRP